MPHIKETYVHLLKIRWHFVAVLVAGVVKVEAVYVNALLDDDGISFYSLCPTFLIIHKICVLSNLS